MKTIPYGRQNITDEDINAVVDVLKSDYLTQGPNILEFENDFAKYIGVKYAVACSNGTAALHLSALALDVQKGDKWITTPNTFLASANCILYCGGDIDFVDINKNTFLLDLDKLEEKLVSAPQGTYKGIIPVDFAGYPTDMERLHRLAKTHNLRIIEDACHAPGAYFTDSLKIQQQSGNCQYSDLAIFSFHPVKHIACGEGGMVTTNDETLYRRLLNLRTHGIQQDKSKYERNDGIWYYEMQELGYNYRITNLQAALGISQLKRAETGVKKRNQIAEKYDNAFAAIDNIQTPKREDNIFHAFHLYVIQTPKRDLLIQELRKENIFTQVHYIPVHLQPFYQDKGWKNSKLPVVENYYNQCLSLPMFPTLTEEEQDFVIKKVKEICG